MNNQDNMSNEREAFELAMADRLNVWNVSAMPTFQIDEATGVYVKLYVGAAWAAWQAALSTKHEAEPVAVLNSIWGSDSGWQYNITLAQNYATDKYLESIDGHDISLYTHPQELAAAQEQLAKKDEALKRCYDKAEMMSDQFNRLDAKYKLLQESNENWMEGFKAKERDLADADNKLDAAQAEIDSYREALQCVIKHHTEPAGMTTEIATHKEKLAEFLSRCDASEAEMIAKVKQALSSPSTALQEYEQMKADAERYRYLRNKDLSEMNTPCIAIQYTEFTGKFINNEDADNAMNQAIDAIRELKSTTKDMV
jgi:chromosome segregation ATPase